MVPRKSWKLELFKRQKLFSSFWNRCTFASSNNGTAPLNDMQRKWRQQEKERSIWETQHSQRRLEPGRESQEERGTDVSLPRRRGIQWHRRLRKMCSMAFSSTSQRETAERPRISRNVSCAESWRSVRHRPPSSKWDEVRICSLQVWPTAVRQGAWRVCINIDGAHEQDDEMVPKLEELLWAEKRLQNHKRHPNFAPSNRNKYINQSNK